MFVTMRSRVSSASMMLLMMISFRLYSIVKGEENDENDGSGENSECGLRHLVAHAEVSGTLRSPNFPNKYPENSECWWTITASAGDHVWITVISFKLEKCCDHLQLYDVPSAALAADPYTSITSNDVSSTSILSNRNYVTLKFTSDPSIQQRGFELNYSAIAIACPSLSTPSNGVKVCYHNDNNTSTCTFACKHETKLSGSEHRFCQLNGTWTGNQVTCDKIDSCEEIPVPENGRRRCTNGTNLGSECQFWCNEGHVLLGDQSQTCLGSGYWSKYNKPSCQKSACPTLQIPRNGDKVCYGQGSSTSLCVISCDTGFKLSGSEQWFCQSDGIWNGNPVTCDKITSCFEQPGLENGKKRCTDGSNIGSECHFWCDYGYELRGSDSVTCGVQGYWSGWTVSCLKCSPSNLSAVAGSSASLQSPNYPKYYPSNSECWWTITAPVGYHVKLTVTTFEVEKCCTHLELYDVPSQAAAEEPYASISFEDVSSASILSNENYVTLKFKSSFSFERKGFELNYKAIEYICQPLSVPSNGSKICYTSSSNTSFCKFSCDYAYKLSGSENRSCESNKTWTGKSAICNKITSCPALPDIENGGKRCTNGNKVGSECLFWCAEGYQLMGDENPSCEESGSWSSDEITCQSSFLRSSASCTVDRSVQCDGYYNCHDQSDEKGCSCPHHKFECDCYETGCPSKEGCIKQSLVCDGINHCGDWSDERNCRCSDTRFQCTDGTCIDRSKINDGRIDCVNADDEFNCNMTHGRAKCGCVHDTDQCTSSGRCIPSNWVGDSINDCDDHSDEPCNASKVWCNECWVIINRCSTNKSKSILMKHSTENATKCHHVTIPSDKNRKLKSSWMCITSACGKCLSSFQCQNGHIIDNDYYCDTIRQCNDGSDEDMKLFGFRCSGKRRKNDCVLPQKNVYDSIAQCADNSDLCFVNGEFRCFQCLDGRLIVSAKQVCDGIVDCYDMSDECLCANQTVCNAVLGEEMSRCPFNQMHCYNETDCVDMDKVLCQPLAECLVGNNLKFCHQGLLVSETMHCMGYKANVGTTIIAARCDGRPECAMLEDECYCHPRPAFCDSECAQQLVMKNNGGTICDGYLNAFYPGCVNKEEQNCPMRFICKSNDMISIDVRFVCDGIIDCDDHSDENNTNCQNKRFYCTKGNAFSINKDYVCDGIKDCDNGEDETHKLCGNKRFYCESGEPISVDKKSLENGINDCSDGSDECISLFSDRYEMIANPILRALFWIMGFLALIGNLTINLYTTKDMFSWKNNNIVKMANNVFIWNLTISDFLMGVYLIVVVAQRVRYSGSYCLVDKQWRSSNLCSGLGTLALLSSETSVLIMAAMSTFRLVTVYKPFLSSSINIKWIVIACCSCWVVSIFLATLPWISFQSGYFISDVWFPNIFYKTNTVSKLDMFISAKRIIGNNSQIDSWFEVKKIISNTFPYNPINGEFGYYSGTSVCMPRFYASTNEAAWQYSIFLITLNFLLFIYMVVVYILVYINASAMMKSVSHKDENKGMQKRISRLLLTDFFCWIPVCMLGYLSVAGVSLPPTAYIVSAGFLLPINSATNPILYSKFIGQKASRAKENFVHLFSTISSNLIGQTEVAEELNDSVEIG